VYVNRPAVQRLNSYSYEGPGKNKANDRKKNRPSTIEEKPGETSKGIESNVTK